MSTPTCEAATASGLLADDGEVSVRRTICSGLDAGIADPRQIPPRAVRPEGPVIEARFFYDLEPGENERELVAQVETYVAADFDASLDVDFRAEFLPVDVDRVARPDEHWVYRRYEPDAF